MERKIVQFKKNSSIFMWLIKYWGSRSLAKSFKTDERKIKFTQIDLKRLCLIIAKKKCLSCPHIRAICCFIKMSFKLKLFRLFTNSPPLPHDSISLFCQTLETIYSSWGNNVLLLDMGENELPEIICFMIALACWLFLRALIFTH